jgi:hypothetical protein
MKRLIALVLGSALFAALVPQVAFAGNPQACTFTKVATTWRLNADCTTYSPIVLPAGLKLDGQGHTITASGNNFSGGVIDAFSTFQSIENLVIDGAGVTGDPTFCNFYGIWVNQSGSINSNTIIAPADFDCSSIGIRVDNGGQSAHTNDIHGNTITGFDTGITFEGLVNSLTWGNVIHGVSQDLSYAGIALYKNGSIKLRQNTITDVETGVVVIGTPMVETSNTTIRGTYVGISYLNDWGSISLNYGSIVGNTITALETGIRINGCDGDDAVGTANAIAIRNNRVTRLGNPDAQYGGIELTGCSGNVDKTQVQSNTLVNWINPLFFSGDTHTVVAGNVIITTP